MNKQAKICTSIKKSKIKKKSLSNPKPNLKKSDKYLSSLFLSLITFSNLNNLVSLISLYNLPTLATLKRFPKVVAEIISSKGIHAKKSIINQLLK
jgi:hypothetical protein